ncbi:hypothetical protein DYH09_00715 [bacterium CPR1]|nr:hypothetical protein [bacterium CPR1]
MQSYRTAFRQLLSFLRQRLGHNPARKLKLSGFQPDLVLDDLSWLESSEGPTATAMLPGGSRPLPRAGPCPRRPRGCSRRYPHRLLQSGRRPDRPGLRRARARPPCSRRSHGAPSRPGNRPPGRPPRRRPRCPRRRPQASRALRWRVRNRPPGRCPPG